MAHLDLIVGFREATRILHFDHSDQAWLKDRGGTAGRVMAAAERPHGAVGAPGGWCSRARGR
jgi:hypothetical protein